MITHVDLVGRLEKHSSKTYPRRKKRHVKRVVIHHTAVRAPANKREEQRQIRAINRGHIYRGWPGIGYHVLIGPSGTVYKVNDYLTVTNHVGGYNRSSIGVSLMGQLHIHRPTEPQLAALAVVLESIKDTFGPLDVVGHNDLNDTICPGNWLVEDTVSYPKTYFGYHAADDGNITDQAFDNFTQVNAATVLLHLDRDQQPTDYHRLASVLPDDSIVIVRLYMPGHTRWTPDEFVHRTMQRIDLPYGAFRFKHTVFQIHNEPNHVTGLEGWGKTAEDAKDFCAWYDKVYTTMRGAGFENLAFPPLALGAGNHNEREWAEICTPSISMSQLLGVHCYWQDEEEIDNIDLGKNYEWYRRRFPYKEIIVSEVANSSVDKGIKISAQTQAGQYAKWMRDANGKILAATFFMMGGDSRWKGFDIFQATAHNVARMVKETC